MLEFGDGLTNVLMGQVVALLGELGQIRGPTQGQFLEGADVDIAVMKIIFQLRHEAGEKTTIMPDRLPHMGETRCSPIA